MTTQTSSTQPPLSADAASPSRKSSTSTPSDSVTATPARDSESPWPIMPVTPMNALGRKGHNRIEVGQVFGRLQVTSKAEASSNDGHRMWECVCMCGGKVTTIGSSLNQGATSSCGCLRREMVSAKNTTHGKSYSKAYISWCSMHYRCGSAKATRFMRYGGRGISVCRRWGRFENFYEDMGDPPPGRTIERIDNDKGYTPENCKWATHIEQSHNMSTSILTWDTVADIRSSTLTIGELAEQYGTHVSTISGVIRNKRWVNDEYVYDRSLRVGNRRRK